MVVRVFNTSGEMLFAKDKEAYVKFSFTTFDEGTYEFCIGSREKTYTLVVSIDIRSGFEAKDYSKLPSKKDLRPMA